MRAFVAVWPPPDVVARLAEIDRPARSGIRWTTEDQWHVTLRFLGEIDEAAEERGKSSLAALVSGGGATAVMAVGGPCLEPLGSSIWCIPVVGLEPLAAAVLAATAGIVAPAAPRPFRGHVTIARGARGVRLGLPSQAAFSAAWTVDEVTLVASTLHPAGARYRVVGRYRLPG